MDHERGGLYHDMVSRFILVVGMIMSLVSITSIAVVFVVIKVGVIMILVSMIMSAVRLCFLPS